MQIGNRKALSGDQRAGHFHGLVVGLMGGGVAKFAKHSITLQSDQPRRFSRFIGEGTASLGGDEGERGDLLRRIFPPPLDQI